MRKYRQFVLGIVLTGLLATCVLTLAVRADDWPQWRGPRRDGLSLETGLLTQWPEGGPKKLWTARASVGYVETDDGYTADLNADAVRARAIGAFTSLARAGRRSAA